MYRSTINRSLAGHRLHSLLKSLKCLLQVHQLFKQCEVFKDYENHVEKYFCWGFFFLNWNTEHDVCYSNALLAHSSYSFHFWPTSIHSQRGKKSSAVLLQRSFYQNDINLHTNVYLSRFTWHCISWWRVYRYKSEVKNTIYPWNVDVGKASI